METISPQQTAHPAPTAPPTAAIRVDLTTETRWFFDGPIPDDVRTWFTNHGASGLREQRCDPYRVGETGQIGVKLRSGTVLERKERLRDPEPFSCADGSTGAFETWQRWSPAVHGGEEPKPTVWVEVRKVIHKRRFDADGSEIELTPETRPMDGVGCDAEIVELDVDGRPSWGFAFAAFGSVPDHRPLIWSAWNALLRDEPAPGSLDLRRGMPYGYPEWLIQRCRAVGVELR